MQIPSPYLISTFNIGPQGLDIWTERGLMGLHPVSIPVKKSRHHAIWGSPDRLPVGHPEENPDAGVSVNTVRLLPNPSFGRALEGGLPPGGTGAQFP